MSNVAKEPLSDGSATRMLYYMVKNQGPFTVREVCDGMGGDVSYTTGRIQLRRLVASNIATRYREETHSNSKYYYQIK